MYRWIKLSTEAQDAARWCAERGHFGNIGDPLPNLLSYRALKEINNNLRWFRMAVHIFAMYPRPTVVQGDP